MAALLCIAAAVTAAAFEPQWPWAYAGGFSSQADPLTFVFSRAGAAWQSLSMLVVVTNINNTAELDRAKPGAKALFAAAHATAIQVKGGGSLAPAAQPFNLTFDAAAPVATFTMPAQGRPFAVFLQRDPQHLAAGAAANARCTMHWILLMRATSQLMFVFFQRFLLQSWLLSGRDLGGQAHAHKV